MNQKKILLVLLSTYATFSMAQTEYKIEFDAKYTYGVIHTPSAFTLPAATSLKVSFNPTTPGTLFQSGSTTSLRIVSENNSVFADSPIFNDLPAPHIAWNAGNTGGEVRIERNDLTSQYRLIISSDLSYSLGCILGCTNYFKAVSLVSDYAVISDYSPFEAPARFIADLHQSRTSFESGIFQDSWYRVSGRDRYSGAYISTSYNTLGFGQYWQDGGAKISGVSVPIPEPGKYILFLVGIAFLTYSMRKGR